MAELKREGDVTLPLPPARTISALLDAIFTDRPTMTPLGYPIGHQMFGLNRVRSAPPANRSNDPHEGSMLSGSGNPPLQHGVLLYESNPSEEILEAGVRSQSVPIPEDT